MVMECFAVRFDLELLTMAVIGGGGESCFVLVLFLLYKYIRRQESHIFAHLRKFGLCMHVGRGNAASKTEAMYFPPPRMAYEAADTSRFYIDGTGFIDFCEKFK